MAIATAVERDQVGAFTLLADAVDVAAGELESSGSITESTWNQLIDSAGPGPLQGLVESQRG
jgi:hypothetical protein